MTCPDGEYWSWPAGRPDPEAGARAVVGPASTRTRSWTRAYAAARVLLSRLLIVAVLAGAALPVLAGRRPDVGTPTCWACWSGCRCRRWIGWECSLCCILVVVRGAGCRREARHRTRVRSGRARGLDDGAGAGRRLTWLFPLYASSLTPIWLRARWAPEVGKDVEAWTVLLIPSLTQVNDQSFLADDTLIGAASSAVAGCASSG